MRKSNERLESEIVELRSHLHSTHEAPLLAAPGAMISTLARRVASQLGADSSPPAQPPAAPPSSSTSDNLEESMRKVNKYVGTIRTSSFSLDLVFHFIWICFTTVTQLDAPVLALWCGYFIELALNMWLRIWLCSMRSKVWLG